MFQKIACLFLCVCFAVTSFAQKGMATIHGIIKDEQGKPIDAATIAVQNTGIGTQSAADGKYQLEVPAGHSITVVFTYLNADPHKKNMQLQPGEKRTVD